MSAFCFLFCFLEQYECHQAMKEYYARWFITIKYGFHVAYLLGSLQATVQSFGGENGGYQGENLENKRKENEHKKNEKEKQLLLLFLYCTFRKICFSCCFILLSKKEYFFMVTKYRGHAFWRKEPFLSAAMHRFASEVCWWCQNYSYVSRKKVNTEFCPYHASLFRHFYHQREY